MTTSNPRKLLHRLLRSWLNLTDKEQLAVIIVLGLFLLGQVVRCWHLTHPR